ncbi:extracellular solute-binding protein [Microbacterium sp. ASV49]|uniref:Extracellular solute-binding protein n=1 Tax=Microbacterium candidum TaxID=3041922 RepID=A0ABT7MYC1_9MICO|nr:extracellular solute-binding protein [Microbacterium sp. ASV49]MDL9979446.1 extracellular solute-binding protein [Microbacterium sp. ASV49]
MSRINPKMRYIVAIGAASALALGMAGCSGGGGSSSGSKTVVFATWGSADELKKFKEFDADFMKRHPDITVKLQPVASYDDYHSKLLAQLASNTAPDVFYVGDDKIGQFVDSGRLMDMTSLMDSSASKSKASDFFPGLWGAALKDNKYYAAPNDANPDVMWFDTAALKAAGITENPADLAAQGKWTTSTYLQMNDKLKAAGLTGSIFWNYWSTHYSWISSQGGTAYDKSGKFVGNTDPTTQSSVDQLGKYFQDGKFVVADTLPQGAGADSIFVSHKTGFYIEGRYGIATAQQSGTPQDYDIAPWPTPDGKAAPTGVATSYLAMNSATKSKDASFTFWTEWLSAEGQTFRLSGSGNAVPSIKGADKVVLEGYPAHAQTFLDMRDIGFEDYATEARVPNLSTDISDLYLKLYQGKSTGKDTLDQSAALIKSKTGQ